MIKFNPFSGKFDFVGSSISFDLILTGPTQCLYSGDTIPLDVLVDQNGNVLTGV